MVLNEEQMKEKYKEFQYIQKQIEQVSEHIEMLNQQRGELDATISAMNDLVLVEPNSEILAPIANGIFIKGTITDKKLVVNVGADTTVERTIPEVITLLEKQKEEITENTVNTEKIMHELTQHAMTIFRDVEENVQQTEE
ncbi:prefoldin subunit alpha [Candidatus Woesearchaeota archaeon]|nr:prefoldin subunit alpha [Candidatus Woesearchaeota archaeon]